MEGKTTIEKLMERGKATGELTTKEISDALEELDFDVDQLNSFYDTCDRLNIKIIDDTAPEISGKGGDADLVDDLEMALSTEGIAIDDPVKVYPPMRKRNLPSGWRRAIPRQKIACQKQTCVWLSALQRSMSAEACSSWI